jgi:hypothetical protein
LRIFAVFLFQYRIKLIVLDGATGGRSRAIATGGREPDLIAAHGSTSNPIAFSFFETPTPR